MDIGGFKYSKSESYRSVDEIEAEPSGSCVEESEENNLALKDGYAKYYPTVETAHVFIISGGERKEKDYFESLRDGSRRLKVVFVSKKKQGLTPSQMRKEVDAGIEEESFVDIDGRFFSYMEGDRIFMVTDVDHYRREIEEELRNPNPLFRWIISNPDFEIWLFYHYFDTPDILKEDWPSEDKLKSHHLKWKLGELKKDKGGVNAFESLALINDAIDNSESNYTEDATGIPTEFSTQMNIVGRTILDVMRDDFGEMLKRRSEEARRFRTVGVGKGLMLR